MKKIIIIGGATASGKSSLAIKVAKKYNGEIISADSRQIYKNIPQFTGVVLEEEMDNVPHHLISFLEEDENFSSSEFSLKAENKIEEILEKEKTPIIVGGSTFYFEPLIYKNLFPEVYKNLELRSKLEKKETIELFSSLKEKDQNRSENIDPNNRPRLIRALEIIEELGKVPEVNKIITDKYEIFFIWLSQPIENQREKIALNIKKRIEKGLLEEGKLVFNNFSKKYSNDNIKERFIKLGLGFKHIFDLWENKIDLDEFIEKTKIEEGKYAKKQNTYLKKFFNELPVEIKKEKYDLLEEKYSLNVLKDVGIFLK